MTMFSAKIWQDGIEVASVSGSNPAAVEQELLHYIVQYQQDGDVEIRRNLALRRWVNNEQPW